jgi:hypothetical protein
MSSLKNDANTKQQLYKNNGKQKLKQTPETTRSGRMYISCHICYLRMIVYLIPETTRSGPDLVVSGIKYTIILK